MKTIVVGKVFKHIDTDVGYQVVTFAENPNTKESIVVYQSLSSSKRWWRPVREFREKFQ